MFSPKIILLGCLMFLPFLGLGQNCDGAADTDGDGYFTDVPGTCPTFDPDDADPCVPDACAGTCDLDQDGILNSDDTDDDDDCIADSQDADPCTPEEVTIAGPLPFFCENGDQPFQLYFENNSGNYANHFFKWQVSYDGTTFINIPSSSSDYTGIEYDTLTVLPPYPVGEGACFRLTFSDLFSCTEVSHALCLTDSGYSPPIESSSLCPVSVGECEKVCANSTVTYSVEKEEDEAAFWQVEGAEDFTIGDGEVEVTWGEEGQGEVSVEILPDSVSELTLDCVHGSVQPDVGIGFDFAYISAFSPLGAPYEFSTDGGNSWHEFQNPTYTSVNNLSEGVYHFTVRDASGQSGECSVEIKPEAEFDPIALLAGHGDCDSLAGVIAVKGNQQIGSGSPGGGHEVSVKLTHLATGLAVVDTGSIGWQGVGSTIWISATNPGDYQLEIQDLNSQDYVVKYLTVHCLPACEITTTRCVAIQPEPQAALTADPAPNSSTLSICLGQPISFQNESTGSTTVVWDFGNGATTPAENPEYTYPEPGVYEVKLIARNDCFCADTTTLSVEVTEAQIPDIHCLGTLCEGDTATYSTSVDCNFYQWQISPNGEILAGGNSGDSFVTVAWPSGPTGWVELRTLGCAGSVCPDPVRETIGIIPGQLWAEGPDVVCPHQIAEYSVPAFGATDFTWYVPSSLGTILRGQGTHKITVEWGEHPGGSDTQLAQIEVEYENCFLGCGGQGAIAVQMKKPSFISGPIEICQDESPIFEVELLDGGNGDGHWEITSETGNVVWQSASPASQISPVWDFPAGQYLVKINSTSSSSCSENAGLNVTLFSPPPPVDGILGNVLVCPQSWQAYEAESSLPGAVFSWQIWNGSDYHETTGRTVNVQWGHEQPYRLSVRQAFVGAGSCASEPIELVAKPFPDFELEGAAEICRGGTEVYTTDFFENLDYQWFVEPVGAGGIIGGQGTNTVEVYWQAPGGAVLKMLACGENAELDVLVFSPAQPEILAPDALCPGETAEVTTAQNFSFYQWKNENGGTVSTLPNPLLGPGEYVLAATDENGCGAERGFFISEKPAPETHLSTTDRELCPPGETTTLHALETGDGLSFEWFFGGSQIAAGTNTLEVDEIGTYTLTATDAGGCTASASLLLVECDTSTSGSGSGGCTPSGQLNFSTTPGDDCADMEFQADPTPSVFPGTLMWEFVNGEGQLVGTSGDSPALFSFPHAGHFEVRLSGMVPDLNSPAVGCPTVTVGSVSVPLKAHFSATEACPGLPTEFRDLGTFLPGTSISEWAWDFGDPASGGTNFSQNQHPAHVYAQPGIFTVSLTVTSSEGCVSSFSKNVEIHAVPDVGFVPPAANCAAVALQFSAETSANATHLEWNFGDPASGEGNFSNAENPWHAYPSAAEYVVTLRAENRYGCADSISQNVAIGANNLSGEIFPNDPAPVCEGGGVNLQAPSGGVLWSWSNGGSEESISIMESGVYEVTLTDASGCEHTPAAVPVEILPRPEAAIRALELNEFGQAVAYQEGSFSACEGETIFLEMVGLPKYTYEWSDGSTGEQLTLSAAAGNLLPAGIHAFTVTVTNTETGCSSVEGPFPVTVNGAPADVAITSMPEGPICEGTEVVFSVIDPQPDVAYQWNTGQSGTEATAISGGAYLVQATNVFGCSAKSEAIEIHTAAPAGAMPMGCFSSCEPMELCLPEMPEVVDFQWFIGGVPVPAPEGNLPTWTSGQSGDYALQMTTVYGCETFAEGLAISIAPQSGNLFGEVWMDVNLNGEIDPPADTLLAGVFVEVFQNNLLLGFQLTQNDGAYFFENFPLGNYALHLDLDNLPGFEVVGDSLVNVSVSACSVNDVHDFLVRPLCGDPLTDTLELNACAGDSAFFNGVAIPSGTSKDFIFPSFQGCDSILTVMVTELPTSEGNLQLSACPGSMATFMGTEIPIGGNEVFVLENAVGCDSILTVTVTELPTSEGNLQLSACPGSMATFMGTEIPIGGSEVFVLENAAGCDSLLTVTAVSLEGDTTFIQLHVCHGQTIEFLGVEFSQNETQVFVLESYFGCDSVVQVSVAELPEISFALATGAICHGTAEGLITVDITNGTPPFTCSLDGVNFQNKPDFTDLPAGEYTVWVQDSMGCLGGTEINIPERPPLHVLVDDYVLPCDEEMVVIRPVVTSSAGEVTWRWDNGSHAQFCPVTKAGIYAFEAEDDCAIESRASNVEWGANAPEDFLYVPNAFSPNDDGVNDIFQTYAPEGADIQYFEFKVFDRWGGLVFETFDQKEGWDGTVDGTPSASGVQVWYVRAIIEHCGQVREIFLEGEVAVIR